MRLTYAETKKLLLSTVDGSANPLATTATITGGRLNVGKAMQALGLLLKQRGLPALPGASLADPQAKELQRKLQENEWGAGLLGAAPVPAPGGGKKKKNISKAPVAAATLTVQQATAGVPPEVAPAPLAAAVAAAAEQAQAQQRAAPAGALAGSMHLERPRHHRRLKSSRHH